MLAIDLQKYFVSVKSVAVATMTSFQSSGIERTELDAPETDRFAGDNDTSLSQKIFEILVTEIESVVEPESVADDVWWEPVPFVGIHLAILSISAR